jgi:radical SAM superfamily enzyme YgiQ (UPF0313 family)
MDRKIYVAYHQGVAQLASLAKAAGHRTSLIVTSSAERDKITARLRAFRPDLVAFSVCTPQAALARDLTGIIASETDAPVLWGGPHPTAAPGACMEIKGVNAVVRGEGERALEKILDGDDIFGGRAGPCVRYDPENPVDLDRLPFGDREIFGFKRLIRTYGKVVGAEMMAGRGCPCACTYCLNPYLNALYGGAYYRRRSMDHVLAEIDGLLTRYPGISLLGFHDDIFTADRDWLTNFCEGYEKQFDVPFWCNVRPGTVTGDDWEMLRRAGLIRAHIGIESGSERIRKDVLGRAMTDEEILSCFAGAAARGVRTVAFNMIGLPGERARDFDETIALNRRARPDWLILSVFNPYPGTVLYERCRSEGMLAEAWPASYYMADSPLRETWLSREALAHFTRHFVRLVRGQTGP